MPAISIYCVKLSFPSAYDVRFIADETNDGWKVEVKTKAMWGREWCQEPLLNRIHRRQFKQWLLTPFYSPQLWLSENGGGGARFEITDAPETIGPDLTVSVLSQSFTKASGR